MRRTISIRERTFDVLHFFWIPLMPIGFHSRWLCGRCRQEPHEPQEVRGPVRVIAMLFFLVLAALFWYLWLFDIVDPGFSEDPTVYLGLAIFATIMLLLTVFWARRYDSDNFAALIAAVEPFDGFNCPLCDGPLDIHHTLKCRDCGAEHEPLR